MAKNKLDSIRRLYNAQEATLARELKRLKEERVRHDQQLKALADWLDRYRSEYAGRVTLDAEQARRLQRFQQQIVATANAEDERAQRLAEAERSGRDAWLDAHRQRVGIDRVLERRNADARDRAKRRSRRQSGRTAPPAWSTLKREPGPE